MKQLLLTAFCLVFATALFAQDDTDSKNVDGDIHIEIKEGQEPDIYVDGKKFDFPIGLLDKNKIATVNVIKGEKALAEYNAENGVVLVTTKSSKDYKTKFKFKNKGDLDKVPMVIIDGEVSDQKALKKLSSDDIERIDIVKGEAAKAKYNALNGVVIVHTKKQKNKSK